MEMKDVNKLREKWGVDDDGQGERLTLFRGGSPLQRPASPAPTANGVTLYLTPREHSRSAGRSSLKFCFTHHPNAMKQRDGEPLNEMSTFSRWPLFRTRSSHQDRTSKGRETGYECPAGTSLGIWASGRT